MYKAVKYGFYEIYNLSLCHEMFTKKIFNNYFRQTSILLKLFRIPIEYTVITSVSDHF